MVFREPLEGISLEECMKRVFIASCLIMLLASFALAQRLPEGAAPESYKITLAPDLTRDNFTGEVTIQIRLSKPASQIVLNSAEIEFQDAALTSGDTTQKATVTLDAEKQFATLAFEKEVPAGPATLTIHYTGILNDALRGFYLSKANGRKYAVTQLESTDARRAFPCFDEPAYKATFDLTVIADKGDTGIANGKIISDKPGPGEGKHTIRFATTPKMSSYLVELAVGDFEYIEGTSEGIPIRVWTTPGKKQMGTFALECAKNFLQYYNHYFEIKYPFEKLDLIAFPDFEAGAMENVAAITFREEDLLLDDKLASVDAHKQVAIVISHEVAHQWFGDLVTMQWWDDIWLNEGFASWMEYKPPAVWKPEWNLNLDEVLSSGRALDVDSLANTRPIQQAAETPDEIYELFDGIAYGKTAAVLRMLETYLGPETFRAGVNRYIKEHAYGNATADDFWRAMAAASNLPVDQIMPTFVKQAGTPLVTVKTQCSGDATTVTLSQQRYFYDSKLFNAGSKERWMIPVCLKTKGTAADKKEGQCDLLKERQQDFKVKGCAPWVMANAGAMGYYHTGYDRVAINAISANLLTAFTPAERIQLLADVWASVQVGQQPIGDYLALADGLRAERSRAVMEQLTAKLQYIGDHLLPEGSRNSYELWVRTLLAPSAKELGWQPRAGENDDRKTLRSNVIYTLGYTGRDPDTLAQATKLAQQILSNPASVDGSMAATILNLAALHGDSALYDQMRARMKKATAPEEYYNLQSALAHFTDPKLLTRTLVFALTPDVRSQDMPRLLGEVLENPEGTRIGWDFVQTHWNDISKVLVGYNSGAPVRATGTFCDADLRKEVKDFFATHKVPSAERRLRQSLERIGYCVDLKSRQANQLASWLQDRSTVAAK
jgi:puromycin-sensitive aminopeptidase